MGDPYQPAEFSGPPFTGGDAGKTKIYYGGCHCGACTMAVRTMPLPEVDKLVECNCAYCLKDAHVNLYPSSDQVHLGGADNLQLFSTDPSGGGGFFCKTCGVGLFDADLQGAKDAQGEKIANATETLGHDWTICTVNLRALRDVEWDRITVERYDGRSNDPQFQAD